MFLWHPSFRGREIERVYQNSVFSEVNESFSADLPVEDSSSAKTFSRNNSYSFLVQYIQYFKTDFTMNQNNIKILLT